MSGAFILFGIVGILSGILLILIQAMAKKGFKYQWSILISVLSFILFIIGIAINPDFQSSFRQSFRAGLAAAQGEAETKPAWNIKDLNVATNGNIAIALQLLIDDKVEEPAIAASPAAVFKAPWRFYGQVIKLHGVVSIAQDYPPGSDVSMNLNGREAGELVLVADDGTLIDYLHLGSTGALNVGDDVSVQGYCTGHIDVQNALGGTTTQLMIVGDRAEAL